MILISFYSWNILCIVRFYVFSFFFSFLQDCPEGVVHETAFKDIYAKFFPHGSKYYF